MTDRLAALEAELTAAQQLAFSQGIELGALRADLAIAQQQARDYSCRVGQLEREQTRLQADLAASRKLEDAVTQMSRAARSLEKRIEAEKAQLARARDQYTDLAELLFGEAEYEHEDAHRRLSDILGDLARARAVLESNDSSEGEIETDGGKRIWLLVDTAPWQAWREGQR